MWETVDRAAPCPLRVDRNSVIIVARSLSPSFYLPLPVPLSLPLQLHRDFHFRFNWKYVKMFPFFSCAFKEGVSLGAAAACVWFVTSPTPSPFHSPPPWFSWFLVIFRKIPPLPLEHAAVMCAKCAADDDRRCVPYV